MKPTLLLTLIALLTQAAAASGQGTAFTYQGRLNEGATPAGGTYDLRFTVHDASIGGNQSGPALTNAATAVSNGLFTVTLDFGNQFPGAARWLEISVRTNGSGSFFTLSPRQALTPAPYAITAGSVISGGLAAGTYGNAVTLNNAANQISGSFTGNGANVTNVNAASLGGLTASNFWQTGGNNVAAGQFLGSANNQPVELRANNQRVMQYAYASNAVSGFSPNVIGGNSANTVAAGVVGAAIGGGGVPGLFGPNAVNADFGTVVGGAGSSATGRYGIAGGGVSSASGKYSVAFGSFSVASGDYSVALGNSTASGTNSAALGKSSATNSFATASGNSTAYGQWSTALGNSTAGDGWYSTAMGQSTAMSDWCTAMGRSSANGYGATAMGVSTVSGSYATAMGLSTASGYASLAAGDHAFADHYNTFVWNDGNAGNAQSGGADEFHSTAPYQFLISARNGVGINTAAPETGLHVADSSGITIGQSATSGGRPALRIDLSGALSELQAIAAAGSSYGNLILQGHGGRIGIGTYSPATALDVNGTVSATSFNTTSDRNAKEKFAPVNSLEVLAKVAALPIAEWQFKTEPSMRHIGPVVQDFHAAFGVGPDDQHIATVDADGVALAAIQGLNQKLEETRSENAELKARLERLEKLLADLRHQ